MNAAFLVALLLVSQQRAFVLSGQSLSTGVSANTALSTTQTRGNTIWTGNTNNTNAAAPTEGTVPSLTTALVEASVESPRSAMANCYQQLTGNSVLAMATGLTAIGYSGLKVGTAPWVRLINMMEAYGARIGGRNLGLFVVHGETDRASATYCTDMLEWQASFDALSTRTGGGAGLPIYVSQASSCTFYSGATLASCPAFLAQHSCARDNPTRVVVIGPKYHFATSDGVHMTNATSRVLGEQMGRVLAWGPTWTGVRPRAVSANGAAISIQMYVPVPPLVLDTTAVTNPGDYGFTYTDDSSPPAISSVALAGDDTVIVTLASTPVGANRRIRYAYTGTASANAGPTTGMRGNIRDSDTTTCGSGTVLRNWAVHFEESVQ